MELPELVAGRFVRRDNRFRATVIVDDQMCSAHVPNSGRLRELFTSQRPLWLAPAGGSHRKTAYDLKLVEYHDVLVSVDARLPNSLLAESLAAGQLPGFDFPNVDREVFLGHSRLDFRLSGPRGVCWLESKSVTLVEEGVAMFPDAPTSRGRRHLLALIDAAHQGQGAAVVFVIQRPDAHRFTPHAQADPAFAETLRLAASVGVSIHAYTCRVSRTAITIADEIPVALNG
ncbi:MAG: DNA/RNA nuclease SfsA [Candidatus Promineifilaceae bacterium]